MGGFHTVSFRMYERQRPRAIQSTGNTDRS